MNYLDFHMRAMDRTYARARLVPDSTHSEEEVYSGIPHPSFNCAYEEGDIEEKIRFFRDKKVPFIWTVTVRSDNCFPRLLKEKGFTSAGIVHGLIGNLTEDKIERPDFPGYEFRKAKENEIHEFTNLVGSIMKIDGVSREFFEEANKKTISLGQSHWIALKKGEIVSAMTTFVQGNIVSYWNRVTIPDERGKGLNRRLAMEATWDAIAQHRCSHVVTYVEDENVASIDRERFGLKNEWSYETFLPPEQPQ